MFATKCCWFLCFKDAMVLTKWGLFFLEARHVRNNVLLISLFQRCHGVNKMGLFFHGGTPWLQQNVADFFVSETPWC